MPPLAFATCALVLALSGCGGGSGTAAASAPRAGRAYTLMQMNLCLSGLAGCYGKVQYPAGLQEAVWQIREAHPDAVTLNEACSGDVTWIAGRTGYHPRFSKVIYHGKPLPCIHPGRRGIFGDAVITKAGIKRTDSGTFAAQAGPERRQWLCVSTRIAVEVCTAHLASHEIDEAAANDPQCAELSALLARPRAHTVIFGGDVNRRASCAPRGFWSETDASARQDPGNQHVYGTSGLRSRSVQVLPASHTDHDVLVLRADLVARR
jgi:hypothetical protein